MTFNLDQFGNGPDDDQYPVNAFALVEIEYDAGGNFYEIIAVYLDREKAEAERKKKIENEVQVGKCTRSFAVWETELVR